MSISAPIALSGPEISREERLPSSWSSWGFSCIICPIAGFESRPSRPDLREPWTEVPSPARASEVFCGRRSRFLLLYI